MSVIRWFFTYELLLLYTTGLWSTKYVLFVENPNLKSMDISSILHISEGQKFDFPTINFTPDYTNCGGWFVSFWIYEESKIYTRY